VPIIARASLIKIAVLLAILAAAAAAAWFVTHPQPVEVSIATVDEGLVEATVANTRAGTVEACRRS
jgi:HlyD family secretion protein